MNCEKQYEVIQHKMYVQINLIFIIILFHGAHIRHNIINKII